MTHDHIPSLMGNAYESNFAIVPFSKTYDEAFDLLVEARNFLTASRAKRRDCAGEGAIARCVEEMRMTSRLIRSMSWLLAVRAVENGEIGWEDTVDSSDLMADLRICTQETTEDIEGLSAPLRDLMGRAYSLYMRTARMELQVAARCSR